jgi:hypothetical protein
LQLPRAITRQKKYSAIYFPDLESLETKCAAILAFLKEKGIATDEELAHFVEQAADASGVKWHAARLEDGTSLRRPT